MGKLFTDAQELRIIEEYLSGIDQSDLGRIYSVDPSNIRNVLKRHKVDIRPRCSFDIGKAIEMYNNNTSYEDIAKIVGVHGECVRRALTKRGIVSRKPARRHTYSCDTGFFNKFTPESCYWAGFLAADGCIQSNRDAVRLFLSIDDKKSIEDFLACTHSTYPIYTQDRGHCVSPGNGKLCEIRPQVGVAISCSQWVTDLRDNFSVVPCKSKTLQPPTNLPDPMVWHFLRGYFDGDGCAQKKNSVVFTTASNDFAQWILSKIGGCIVDNKGTNNVTTTASRIGDRLYKDSTPTTRMERKYLRVKVHCPHI